MEDAHAFVTEQHDDLRREYLVELVSLPDSGPPCLYRVGVTKTKLSSVDQHLTAGDAARGPYVVGELLGALDDVPLCCPGRVRRAHQRLQLGSGAIVVRGPPHPGVDRLFAPDTVVLERQPDVGTFVNEGLRGNKFMLVPLLLRR